ncbi:MAG TPA: type II toxin-antitoxin system Phd/YefM family antitoxin [Nitrospira sp.]|nr:type II toxin-antitoxin system Phd/YefM family antitoxin [Nitrospira sp.]
MTTIRATQAKSRLRQLMEQTARSHEPIVITDDGTNAVLLSEDDWRAVQETVYLLSIPGMRESIRKGLKTPIARCAKDLRW